MGVSAGARGEERDRERQKCRERKECREQTQRERRRRQRQKYSDRRQRGESRQTERACSAVQRMQRDSQRTDRELETFLFSKSLSVLVFCRLVPNGLLSPMSPVTLDKDSERLRTDMPTGSTKFCYAHPIDGSERILELMQKAKMSPQILNDKNCAFMFFGGFVYFDEGNEVLGCTARCAVHRGGAEVKEELKLKCKDPTFNDPGEPQPVMPCLMVLSCDCVCQSYSVNSPSDSIQ